MKLSLLRILAFFTSQIVLASLAETIPTAVTNRFEMTPASSPYGEARVIRNISYIAHPAPRQNFDLYLPKKASDEPAPLVVWIHGGAWMMGIKEWDNVKYLVRHGFAIASLDYRISTDTNFPAQIQDCNAALSFILSHAGEYGVSSKNYVVGGASAGGHLALLLGLARQEKQFGADPALKPLAILDFFGPSDLNHQLEDMQAISSPKAFDTVKDAGTKLFGVPLEQAADLARWASPINYVNATNPPVLILQGGKDDLVPAAQSQRLKSELDKAGVKNQLILVQAAGHDGPMFEVPEIQAKVIAFLDDALKAGRH